MDTSWNTACGHVHPIMRNGMMNRSDVERMIIMAVSRGIEPRQGCSSWEIDVFLRLAPCLAGFDPFAHYRGFVRASSDFLKVSGSECVGGSFWFGGSCHIVLRFRAASCN
jgi:hypothetical protein